MFQVPYKFAFLKRELNFYDKWLINLKKKIQLVIKYQALQQLWPQLRQHQVSYFTNLIGSKKGFSIGA
jgi:hypothetical protein